MRSIAGAPSRRPSRLYVQWWYGHLNVVELPDPSHTCIARCWHTADIALIAPALSRATMIGSLPNVAVNQSPRFGIRSARPAHSHSWANTASHSNSRMSGDVYRSAGSVDAVETSPIDCVEARQERVGEHGHVRLPPCVEHVLLDLADARARQLVDEADIRAALGLAEVIGAPLLQFGAQRVVVAGVRCRHDERDGYLVADASGTPTTATSARVDVAPASARPRRSRRSRRRPSARPSGDLRTRSGRRSIAAGAVAGQEPAVAERGRRRLGVVEVPREQRDARLAADDDLAVLDVDGRNPRVTYPIVSQRGSSRSSVSTAGIVSVMP